MEIEKRLKGTRAGAISQELFTNSIHFPLANIFLELLLKGPLAYFREPDPYTIIFSCCVQAMFIGTWKHHGKPSRRLLGNLIAPSLYTGIEFFFEGPVFFTGPNHVAFLGFAFTIGLLQEVEDRISGKPHDVITIFIHLVRTCILLVMYGIFEAITEPKYNSIGKFLSNDSHLFVAIVIPLLGVVLGMANVTANRYLSLLQYTAGQLKKYSEWLLGRQLLSAAITDSESLNLQRKRRTVFFMDIRGFTKWSEDKSPETVVNMLNNYFEKAEQIWKISDVIKVKHTADEIMAVFPDEKSALKIAITISHEINDFLKQYGLSSGAGVHAGHLVEGLVGSREVKVYDVIGDTVNTAKRICDHALGGEVLISEEIHDKVKDIEVNPEPRFLQAKGKSKPLKVFSLQ